MRAFSSASHLPPTTRRQTSLVSTFFKVALGLLLTVPLGAYIAGTLVASQADMPDQRPAVVISQTTSGTAGPSETTSPSPTRSARPKPSPTATHDDSDDSDDDDVRVVRPTPREVDDDDDRDDDSDDDSGDDSHDGDDDH